MQLIATSHHQENRATARLLASEGFVAWDIAFAVGHPTETDLRLPD